ncbi:hypothetical protein Tco_1138625 [Tanacetum coccineum]
MVEGSENVIDDSLLHRNDEPKIPDTRLKPRSDKESPKVEITNDKEVEITNDEEVEITNVIIPVNVNEEEEEITDEELQGRYTYLFEHLKARFLSRKSFDTLVDHIQELMVESLPTMVDTHIKEQVKNQVPEQAYSSCSSSSITNTLSSRTTISTVSLYEIRSSVAGTRHSNMARTSDEV